MTLHGTAFWFGRSEPSTQIIISIMPERPASPIKKTKLRQNQYGFVAGGPVWIPKVYDGRNKSFWLVNYEGYRTNARTIRLADRSDCRSIGGAIHFDQSLIRQQASLLRITRFLRTASRAWRNWRSQNFSLLQISPAQAATRFATRNLPLDQTQYTIRGDQQLGSLARSSDVTRKPITRTPRSRTRPNWVTCSSCKKRKNWQISHTIPLAAIS